MTNTGHLEIGGDVVMSGGTLTVNGEIVGKLVVSCESVEITGKIAKDVEISTATYIGSLVMLLKDWIWGFNKAKK